MLYSIIRLLFCVIFRVFFRWEVTGRENIPHGGGLVVASNHLSLIDPIIIGCAMTRKVSYMAKEELFRVKIIGPILRRINAFPVKRGRVDRQAIRTGIKILKGESVLGLFPQGTRTEDTSTKSIRLGAAMFALKTNSPVLPVGICGSDKVLKRGSWLPRLKKIRVKIGTPIYLDKYVDEEKITKADLEAASVRIMHHISELSK